MDEVDEGAALRLVRDRFPDLVAGRVEAIRTGWDVHAFLIDGIWIARVPRRAEAEEGLRREIDLLPVIGPSLPSPVPEIERVSAGRPICVVTRRIVGGAATAHPRTAMELGRFLASLHTFPVQALPLPAANVAAWRAAHEERRLQFEEHVFPLLDAHERHSAADLFASADLHFDPKLVHGDLGPEHVLCADDGHIRGVIDWGDARVGDAAIDLAWALHGAGRHFADALAAAYGGVDEDTRSRAAFYHRRGPWYEVLYGLESDRPDLVTSGLAGVRERLRLEY